MTTDLGLLRFYKDMFVFQTKSGWIIVSQVESLAIWDACSKILEDMVGFGIRFRQRYYSEQKLRFRMDILSGVHEIFLR